MLYEITHKDGARSYLRLVEAVDPASEIIKWDRAHAETVASWRPIGEHEVVVTTPAPPALDASAARDPMMAEMATLMLAMQEQHARDRQLIEQLSTKVQGIESNVQEAGASLKTIAG